MTRAAPAGQGLRASAEPLSRNGPHRSAFIAPPPVTLTIDAERVDAFSDRMVELVNHGLLNVLVSIGHRTKLFDALAGLDWVTPGQLATTAQLDDRYVLEWLSAMACARIVEYDDSTRRFRLPAEHAASLTRAAGSANLAALMSMVGFLAPVEDDIVRCFREGGGLGYDRYPKFAKAMAIQSRVFVDLALLDGILPLISGLRDRLEAGIDVADVGCGAGHALNVLARSFPRSRFTGWDLLDESIELARAEASAWDLQNVEFGQADVDALDGTFDLVTTFVAVHDHARPQQLLDGIAAALRPGGIYLCVDSKASSELVDNLEEPLGAWRYCVSTLHCMSVSLAAGGPGLGDCWGPPKSIEMMRAAGFNDVQIVTPDWLEAFHVYVARV